MKRNAFKVILRKNTEKTFNSAKWVEVWELSDHVNLQLQKWSQITSTIEPHKIRLINRQRDRLDEQNINTFCEVLK